jgi:predicted nucleic acid-binding protein
VSDWRSAPQSPIFVDAPAWIASANKHDQNHELAEPLIAECLEHRVQLVTTNWTTFAALSLLKSRAGRRVALSLWDLFSDELGVELIRVNEEIEIRALELFFAIQDKTWGVVDCASLVVMEDLGCRYAIGFDRHFVEASRQRGFQLLP